MRNVAVFWAQHSPMFGQRALRQMVWRPRLSRRAETEK
jgi:hypothetical protein